MAKLTLYAYVQGTDLDGVVAAVEERLDALVAERTWISSDVWVVNQHEPESWDLGLNLALAAKRTRAAEWIDDLVAIATAFGELHRTTGREFVLGVHDGKETKDLFFVATATPDLAALRAAFSRA